MAGKNAFTEEEWHVVQEGPPVAGMIVLTAQKGGTFRESFALAKAYTEARQHHGESELLDELVAAKPQLDRSRYHSPEGLKEHGLQRIQEAVGLVESKADQADVEAYRGFVHDVASRVADAHKEHGERVSPAEAEAISAIDESLGAASR
jgi:hypothetical protein